MFDRLLYEPEAATGGALAVGCNVIKVIKETLAQIFSCELFLNSRHHIGAKEFKGINWLPTRERVEQRIATKSFKYWKGTSSFHINEIFVPSRNTYKTRSHMALEIPLRKVT